MVNSDFLIVKDNQMFMFLLKQYMWYIELVKAFVKHIDETPSGQGVLNFQVLPGGMKNLPAWTCLVIEYLTDYGQVLELKYYLEGVAREVGVEWA